MHVTQTALPGVLLLTPRQFHDERGMFMETYSHKTMQELGLPTHWPQDNLSTSRRNVVRGLHYQVTQPQGKLVRVLAGVAWDVAVDLRRSSAHFGQHVAVELRAEDHQLLWIPPGFAHGFAALTEQVSFSYKVTDTYCAAGERTVLWNDPELGIAWPVGEPVLSAKDRVGTRLAAAEVFA